MKEETKLGGKKMEALQERVEGMLEGEKKRREVAMQFLQKLEEMLRDACMEMYGKSGNHGYGEPSPATWVMKESKKTQTGIDKADIYFRYAIHWKGNDGESVGFYFSDGYPLWGIPVKKMKGADFWRAIRYIVNWLPLLASEIESRSKNRDNLVEKMRCMVA